MAIFDFKIIVDFALSTLKSPELIYLGINEHCSTRQGLWALPANGLIYRNHSTKLWLKYARSVLDTGRLYWNSES